MTLNETKNYIRAYPGRRVYFDGLMTSPNKNEDSFSVATSFYGNEIIVNSVESIDDIYKIKNNSNINPNIFNQPYYINVDFVNADYKTLITINEIDDNVPVVINVSDLTDEMTKRISKIRHKNIYLRLKNINIENLDEITSKYNMDFDGEMKLNINNMDSSNLQKLMEFNKEHPGITTDFKVKDFKSLLIIKNIMPYLKNNTVLISLDDNILNEKNEGNARELITNNFINFNDGTHDIHINFRGVWFNDLNEVVDLEKKIEVIKSKMPSNASTLDKIVYVSSYICNYMNYDINRYNSHILVQSPTLSELLEKGLGVCEDISIFTNYILKSFNVDSEVVNAYPDEKKEFEEGHSFNVVKIDNKQYFLDNTWLLESIRNKRVSSFADSSNFLRSNQNFGHNEFSNVINSYNCEDYDRERINESYKRVYDWNNDYHIHKSSIKDLFRKEKLLKLLNINSNQTEQVQQLNEINDLNMMSGGIRRR